MAHVAAWKIKEVKELKEAIDSHPVVGIVDISGIAARQLQSMRNGFHENVQIRTARNTLLKIAIEDADNESVRGLSEHISGGSSLVLTDMNPYRLYKLFEKGKTSAPAKGGETCPKDITIEKGDTGFPPGPLVGEMQRVGIPAAIEGGKIVVKKNHVLLHEGDEITPEVAAILGKLDIEPLEVGLNLYAVYEEGFIFNAKDLAIDEEAIKSQFALAYSQSFNLAMNAAIPTKDTIGLLITLAFSNARNLALNANIINDETLPLIISKGYSEMLSLARALDDQSLDDDLKDKVGSFAAAAASTQTPKEDKSEEGTSEEESKEEEEAPEEESMGGLDALFG
ncbi:MAG TPA: 50S ribosomal protein L10 [Candidatus Methanofastidiosa archaeon]|nr:50S ribosomal protein L10 [Candidatus Methanofastidiosa archaeon]HPR41331.1 50S ribosomal protein L10 [Candidatus Methanofastidiosa archaeon]